MKITYSIIAPIYNEKENLPELHRRVTEVMNSTGESWELILVDDGSTDGSTDIIREFAKKDEHIRPVIFAPAEREGSGIAVRGVECRFGG